jgi:hypothetical protein
LLSKGCIRFVTFVRSRVVTKRAIAAAQAVLVALSSTLIAGVYLPHDSGNSARTEIANEWYLPFVADLDGDSEADSLCLRSSGFEKSVDFRLGHSRTARIRFTTSSDNHGRLLVADVDGDNDLDLIWIGDPKDHSPVVLINSGKEAFVKAEDNSPYLAALNALLDKTDPKTKRSLSSGRRARLLNSPFRESGAAQVSRVASSNSGPVLFAPHQEFGKVLPCLTSLTKRGPPLNLS